MTRYIRTFELLGLAVLVGCTTLGLPTAQTFDEKLIAAVSTVTAAREATTTLLNAKKLSSDDAEHILDQLRNARAGLDIARGMAKGDPVAADAKLTTIRTALIALQAYLASKGQS
jgi:hypothetical protein